MKLLTAIVLIAVVGAPTLAGADPWKDESGNRRGWGDWQRGAGWNEGFYLDVPGFELHLDGDSFYDPPYYAGRGYRGWDRDWDDGYYDQRIERLEDYRDRVHEQREREWERFERLRRRYGVDREDYWEPREDYYDAYEEQLREYQDRLEDARRDARRDWRDRGRRFRYGWR